MEFLIYALAVWRISFALVYEEGPWRLLVRFRQRFGIEHDEEGTPIAWPTGTVLACVGCLSIWVASGLLLLGGINLLFESNVSLFPLSAWKQGDYPSLLTMLMLPFAASAVAKLLTDTLYGRGNDGG